jgi:nicotinate-nucleotide--dimethylbenzimidazole phosphoribosyltransferase
MLEHLGLEPLLDFNLRLGEGTGAALGISLCMAACKILDEMATFGEAGVSDKSE